uniref:Uncharacterized protein n=1 Tax=Parascaris univalens TaxID=6257 RepID=A0A915A5M3_PARUN
MVAPPSGGDPLSQVLDNLGALFRGISQPQVPPFPPPLSPPPLSPPTLPPFLPTEAATTTVPTLESISNAVFPTLVTELSVDAAEKVDSGQVSFLGLIPDESTDYYTEESTDSMPDFIDMLSHGEHWTTEGKRNGKNSSPREKSRSNINDGETGGGDHSVIGRPPPLPGLVEINKPDEDQLRRFEREDPTWKIRSQLEDSGRVE